MNETLTICAVAVVLWVLSIYFMRWVFDIDRIAKEATAQRKLLEIIAMKSGASPEDVLEARGNLKD